MAAELGPAKHQAVCFSEYRQRAGLFCPGPGPYDTRRFGKVQEAQYLCQCIGTADRNQQWARLVIGHALLGINRMIALRCSYSTFCLAGTRGNHFCPIPAGWCLILSLAKCVHAGYHTGEVKFFQSKYFFKKGRIFST